MRDEYEMNEREEEEHDVPSAKRSKINRRYGKGVMLSRMCQVPKNYTMDEIRAFDKDVLESQMEEMEKRKAKTKFTDTANLGLLVDYLGRVSGVDVLRICEDIICF